MPFFARNNGAAPAAYGDDELSHPAPAATGPPAMADRLARQMFGIGLSDINAAGERIGTLMADFKAQLERIETGNARIEAKLRELLER
jgi:hypothetical protein